MDEICYSNETPEIYRYRVVLWSNPPLPGNFWYVHDTLKNTFRKIGRIGAKRANYYDRAIEFCHDKQRQYNDK